MNSSAGSINQGATTATASSEVYGSGEPETPTASLAVDLYNISEPLVFLAHHCHFSFKDPCFIGSLGIGRGSGSTYLFKDPGKQVLKGSIMTHHLMRDTLLFRSDTL